MQTPGRTTILDPEMEPDIVLPLTQGRRAHAVTTTWREPLIRGVLAIVMGVVLVALPLSAAFVLAIAFGVYVLVDGVFALIHASRNANPEAGRWWGMVLRGLLGIVVGIFAVVFPSAAAAALGTLIAVWAILAGGLEIAAGVRMHHNAGRETMLIALGVLTVVVGALLLFAPILALVVQIYIFAAYAIVAGIGMIGYAMRLRRRAAPLAATVR